MEILLFGLRVAAAAAVYVFLAAILGMLWRDLAAADEPEATAHRPSRLIVVESEDHSFEPGTAFSLHAVTSIGRGAANTVAIPDTFASTRHALVAWRGSQWWVEDQGSRNGTLLNGLAVDRPTVIAVGDIVTVGRTSFRLERDDEPGT